MSERRLDYVANGQRLPYKMGLEQTQKLVQQTVRDLKGPHKKAAGACLWDLIEILREELPASVKESARRRLR